MKQVLKLLFICSFLNSFSQTSQYFPFPDSNAVWNEVINYPSSTPCPMWGMQVVGTRYSHFINGDTVINSIVYHKVYKSGIDFSYCQSLLPNSYSWSAFNNIYVGGIRHNSSQRKVFFRYQGSNPEFLLYNFNAHIGDTITHYTYANYALTVDSIDSILIGSSYRKRFHVNDFGHISFIIEGIGNKDGLLGTYSAFNSAGSLDCFSQEQQKIYPDMNGTCGNVTSIKDLISHNKLSIYPNPMTDQTTLSFDNSLEHASIFIYNSIGQKVQTTQNVSGNTIIINRGDLPPGVYSVRVEENNQVITIGKVIMLDN